VTPTARTVRVWLFGQDERLTPAYRSGTTVSDAVRALLGGPQDTDGPKVATTIPAGTKLRGISVRAGTAIVDLSGQFASGGGSLSMFARLAQVVFTVTEYADTKRVRFSLDGQVISVLGGEGIDVSKPLTRQDFGDFTPLVLVTEPTPAATVGSPLRVSGLNSTFENTVDIKLVADDGRVLVETYTTGNGPMHDQAGNAVWGPFLASIAFDPAGATAGTLTAYETSAENGEPTAVFSVPVRFGASATPTLPGASTNPVMVPDTPGGPGAVALLVDVRAGRHAGYERVVFEFANMLPGYSVQYGTKPLHADPSDLVVELPGQNAIVVRMAMASGSDSTATPYKTTYTRPAAIPTGYPVIAGLANIGDFEAVLTWAIGVMTKPAFKVTTLTNPPRLVIDVASAGLLTELPGHKVPASW
jgi:Sporulation and spore germination/Immunoglobulin-like domain of bacterial spore germination